MIKNFIIKAAIVSVLFLLNFSIANAKCEFLGDIGEKFKKSDEDKFGHLFDEDSPFAELIFSAMEVCPNDNFDDNFFVKYTFLDKRLLTIQIIADNSIDNSPTESMKLMKYAKRIYGDFDTGGNPKNYNNFNIWEKINKFIVYNRNYYDKTWMEEIFISNDKYYEQLLEYENILENMLTAEDQN